MHDDDRLELVTERFERRLSEENARTRAEIAVVRTDVASMRGEIRAEMIHRNAELLKWILGFLLTQTAGIATLLAIFR